jgi:hypothetical protein
VLSSLAAALYHSFTQRAEKRLLTGSLQLSAVSHQPALPARRFWCKQDVLVADAAYSASESRKLKAGGRWMALDPLAEARSAAGAFVVPAHLR